MKFFNIIFSNNRELFLRIFGKDFGDYGRSNLLILLLFFLPICLEVYDKNREFGFILIYVSILFDVVLMFTYNDLRKEVKGYSTKKLLFNFVVYVTVCFTPFITTLYLNGKL